MIYYRENGSIRRLSPGLRCSFPNFGITLFTRFNYRIRSLRRQQGGMKVTRSSRICSATSCFHDNATGLLMIAELISTLVPSMFNKSFGLVRINIERENSNKQLPLLFTFQCKENAYIKSAVISTLYMYCNTIKINMEQKRKRGRKLRICVCS